MLKDYQFTLAMVERECLIVRRQVSKERSKFEETKCCHRVIALIYKFTDQGSIYMQHPTTVHEERGNSCENVPEKKFQLNINTSS